MDGKQLGIVYYTELYWTSLRHAIGESVILDNTRHGVLHSVILDNTKACCTTFSNTGTHSEMLYYTEFYWTTLRHAVLHLGLIYNFYAWYTTLSYTGPHSGILYYIQLY